MPSFESAFGSNGNVGLLFGIVGLLLGFFTLFLGVTNETLQNYLERSTRWNVLSTSGRRSVILSTCVCVPILFSGASFGFYHLIRNLPMQLGLVAILTVIIIFMMLGSMDPDARDLD